MKICQSKDSIVVMGVLITVISIVAGILTNQIDLVNAELIERREAVFSIPSIQDDIVEIKTDIANIEDKIDVLILRP